MLLILNPVKAGIRLFRIAPAVIKTGKVAKVPVGFGFQLTAKGVQLLGIFYRKRKMMPYFFGCGDIKEVFHTFPIACGERGVNRMKRYRVTVSCSGLNCAMSK